MVERDDELHERIDELALDIERSIREHEQKLEQFRRFFDDDYDESGDADVLAELLGNG